MLDEGEDLLLAEEVVFDGTFGSDIAEEDDDALVRGAGLQTEPEIEGGGVVGLKLAGQAFVHGAMIVLYKWRAGEDGIGEGFPKIFTE